MNIKGSQHQNLNAAISFQTGVTYQVKSALIFHGDHHSVQRFRCCQMRHATPAACRVRHSKALLAILLACVSLGTHHSRNHSGSIYVEIHAMDFSYSGISSMLSKTRRRLLIIAPIAASAVLQQSTLIWQSSVRNYYFLQVHHQRNPLYGGTRLQSSPPPSVRSWL